MSGTPRAIDAERRPARDVASATIEPAGRPRSWSDWVLSRLSRVTSSGRFVPEIDGFRFLAIITVVMLHVNAAVQKLVRTNHTPQFDPPVLRPDKAADHGAEVIAGAAQFPDWLGWLTWKGGVGVGVFFSISGLILALPFAVYHLHERDVGVPGGGGKEPRKPRLREYFIRRLTRLEPPYIISLLLMFPVSVAYAAMARLPEGHRSFRNLTPDVLISTAQDFLKNLGASLLYVHTIIFGRPSVINGVAWSLEIEVQFYILAPLLACVFAIRPHMLRRVILVGATLAWAYATQVNHAWMQEHNLNLTLVAAMPHFLVGFVFADLFITFWRQRPSPSPRGRGLLWDLVGLGAIACIFPASGKHDPWLLILMLAGTFVFFVSVFKGCVIRAIFTNRWITTTGGMCYTIYLIHMPVIAGSMLLTRKVAFSEKFWVNLVTQSLLTLPIVFVSSAVFFALIERPCMQKDWPQRLWAWMRRKPYTAPRREA